MKRALRVVSDRERLFWQLPAPMRVFRYDPFATIPRERCTVGALRAQAGHVDLTPIRGVGGKPAGMGAGDVVRMAQIERQLAGALDG